jgi:hypothetical protein
VFQSNPCHACSHELISATHDVTEIGEQPQGETDVGRNKPDAAMVTLACHPWHHAMAPIIFGVCPRGAGAVSKTTAPSHTWA